MRARGSSKALPRLRGRCPQGGGGHDLWLSRHDPLRRRLRRHLPRRRGRAMSFFNYNAQGDMQVEGVALKTIAQQVGTPFYCYSAGALRAAWHEFASPMKDM